MPLTRGYPFGQTIRLKATFDNGADCATAIDPEMVTVITKSPNAELTTRVYGTDAEVMKDDVGVYHYDFEANESGTWLYRWEATGDVAGIREGSLEVVPSLFGESP